jgi:hypothetical protein
MIAAYGAYDLAIGERDAVKHTSRTNPNVAVPPPEGAIALSGVRVVGV